MHLLLDIDGPASRKQQLEARDSDGKTAIGYLPGFRQVLESGSTEALRLKLKKAADPHTLLARGDATNFERVLLHDAVLLGDEAIVRLLLERCPMQQYVAKDSVVLLSRANVGQDIDFKACADRKFGMVRVNGHNYIGHNHLGHNYTGHNYIGHSYIGHTYIGHGYIGASQRNFAPEDVETS